MNKELYLSVLEEMQDYLASDEVGEVLKNHKKRAEEYVEVCDKLEAFKKRILKLKSK